MANLHAPASKVLRAGTPPVLTGLIVTDLPSGQRTIQDGPFVILLDAKDRVRSARYQWTGRVHHVTRIPKPRRGETPSGAWAQQLETDTYWQRVSALFPRPALVAVSHPA